MPVCSVQDVTRAYIKGAEQTLHIPETLGVRVALLRRYRPSCGTSRVTQDGGRVDGQGATACLPRRAGITLMPLDAPRVDCWFGTHRRGRSRVD